MAIIKIRNAAIDLDAAEIPNLPATKITSGTLDNARISLDAAEIPNLDTAKITTGTLADARVPNLNANKITAGTIATARLGSGTASSSTFLRGDGSFAIPAANEPQFFASRTTNITANSNTSYKIIFDTEHFDTNNAYDNSTGKFQPQVAGTYFVHVNVRWSANPCNSDLANASIYTNGNHFVSSGHGFDGDYYPYTSVSAVIDMNGSSDYLEGYAYQRLSANDIYGSAYATYMFAYRLT